MPGPTRTRTLTHSHSGPAVARLFHAVAGAVLAVAWVSLGVQLRPLIGERGLLPARETLAWLAEARVGWLEAPTLLWSGIGDTALLVGVALGAGLCLLGALGVRSRLCFALNAPLYLSYVVVGDEFLAFQWDNLAVETSVLLACLPRHRPAPLAHLACRVLLFKLYFESGLAKLQSHLGDWLDGSAMTFYYETAPLPTPLAYFAHRLPAPLHHLESWFALGMELLLPFLIFGPRRGRLVTAAVLTGFQIVNTATANYGFFTYLACALHVFLLDDRDLVRVWPRLARERAARARVRSRVPALLGLWLYVGASTAAGLVQFAHIEAVDELLRPLVTGLRPLRVANTYHLFGHITRERVEPEVQIRAGGALTPYDLRYKPGDTARWPRFVAPHQPRLDFRMWFYGLSFRRGMPRYARTLLERVCQAPATMQPFFSRPLPARPDGVRLAFYRYRFSRSLENGRVWTRSLLGHTKTLRCATRGAQGE